MSDERHQILSNPDQHIARISRRLQHFFIIATNTPTAAVRFVVQNPSSFQRASYDAAIATASSVRPSVRPPVCPSVTLMDRVETDQDTIIRFSPYDKSFVFLVVKVHDGGFKGSFPNGDIKMWYPPVKSRNF